MKKLFLLAAAALLTLGMASCGHNNGYVDLGLPSGLLWAECNVGADTPEGYGDHFAWGEVSPKQVYSWKTYAYGRSDGHLTKYCTDGDCGVVDNLTTLKPCDDAATVILGKGARMPTASEWQELLDNCRSEWTQQNGVYGRRFTGPNGKSLFLPAAGVRIYSGALGSAGDYWSASLGEDGPYHAWHVNFHYNYHCVNGYERYYGLSVRAVCPKN